MKSELQMDLKASFWLLSLYQLDCLQSCFWFLYFFCVKRNYHWMNLYQTAVEIGWNRSRNKIKTKTCPMYTRLLTKRKIMKLRTIFLTIMKNIKNSAEFAFGSFYSRPRLTLWQSPDSFSIAPRKSLKIASACDHKLLTYVLKKFWYVNFWYSSYPESGLNILHSIRYGGILPVIGCIKIGRLYQNDMTGKGFISSLS